MVTLKLEPATEYTVLPVDTVITVKIEEIAMRTSQTQDGRSFDRLGFKFKVLSIDSVPDDSPGTYDDMIGKIIYGSVGTKFTNSPDNRLYRWITAILGMDLEPGFELDPQTLVGRTVRATTSQYTKKGSTLPNHQVESLIPMSGASTGSSAPDDIKAPF